MRPGLTTIGDYRTLVGITQAHYGALTLGVAVDGQHSGRVVTLRTLTLGSDVSEEVIEEIVAAAEACRELEHDGIVPVLDVLRSYDDITLVNDHLDGAPLHILARMLMAGREPSSPGVFSRLIADVLATLGILHARSDYRPGGLTPQCVWVGSDGRTRLHEPMVHGHFGSIPLLAGHHERMAYRAPEQLSSSAAPDLRSDLFSVGVMLWELLQRKRLFAGFDAAAIAERITGSDAPRLEGDGISDELAAVVATALARKPSDRYEDAAEMLAALLAASRATADAADVAALVHALLGNHPSVQRVRAAAAKHGTKSASDTPAKAPPRIKPRRRALPTPVRPLTVPLRFKRPVARHADQDDDELVDDAHEPARDSIAELDALLDASSKPAAPAEPGEAGSEEVPPSADSWIPADSVPPPMPTEEEVEHGARRQVGRCELFVEIAHGGMATVYLGRWIGAGGFSKLVAVKAMHPQFTGNPEFASMFLDEARVVARVRHPNVMPTIDLVEADGDLFIVMDYAKGVTLGHLMRQMRREHADMPVPVALRIVHDVLQGLHAAHDATDERGKPMHVVHRDVTPGNVLVGVDGYPKLIDFGIARALGRVGSTAVGQLKGKPGYLAPEQVSGDDVDRRTDVYSASVVLWQALTGRRAFKGDNLAAVGHQILHREVPPPSKRRAGIGAELDRVVMKGMARKPEERWETAEEMADALRGAAELASHREVGQWVRDVARERLAQAEAVLEAVENAPVTLDEDDLDEPLSVRAADRESVTHDVVQAARQLVAPKAASPVRTEPSGPPPATPEPPSRRGIYLAAAAGSVLLAAVLYFLARPAEQPATPAPPPSAAALGSATASPSTARDRPSATATSPDAGSALATSASAVVAASSTPFPPFGSGSPAATRPTAPWPTAAPTATTTTTPTTRLPDGI